MSANRKKITWWQLFVAFAALVSLLLFPLFAKSNYIVSVGVAFCTYACLGTAWNIVGGYAAQISWCHASFVAIGAYTGFLLYIYAGITPWIGLLVGIAISVIVALVIGSVSFRLRGSFFSLCTIAFAEILRLFLQYEKKYIKGMNGLVITYKGESFLNLAFKNDKVFYYLLLGMLVLFTFISWWIQKSKIGFYLRAIKAEEDAAISLGIKTHLVKLAAFVISSAMASAVGTIYAFFLAYIDPAAVSAFDFSVKVGTMAIVGGIGTLFGPLIGTLLLIPLAELSNALLGTTGSGLLLYGASMILVVMFRPGGVISLFSGEDAPVTKFLRRFVTTKRINRIDGEA